MAYSLAAILVAGLTLTQTACGADSGDNPDQATSQTDQSQASGQTATDDANTAAGQQTVEAEPTPEPATPAPTETDVEKASDTQTVAAAGDNAKTAANPATTRKDESKSKSTSSATEPADETGASTQKQTAGSDAGTASNTTSEGDPGQKTAAGGPQAAEKLARSTIDKLLSEIEQRKAELKQDPEALYALIERVLIPVVDVQYLSEQVLGKHWNNASEQQRKRFTKLFTRMVTETYGNALYGFEREQLEYQPLEAPADATDVTFQARAKTDRGDSVPVNLAMHKTDSGWKIYNATIDTLSLISSYRSQFNSQLSAGGMEQLLEKMEQRYGSG